MEKTLTEERSRYQSLLSEHLHLEEQHRDLKEEMSLSIVWGTSVFTINTPWILATECLAECILL